MNINQQQYGGLMPTSNEFVPGRYGSTGSFKAPPSQADASLSAMAGLNSGASAWVPGAGAQEYSEYENDYVVDASTLGGQQGEEEYYGGDNTGNAAAGDNSLETMVEVTWNGDTFYVPQSMTYTAEDGSVVYMGPVEEDGLEWANGSSTLPAPPKRCLKSIGLSEPIRQHFQNLDMEALRQMKPDDDRYKEIPLRYHSAYPLDPHGASSAAGGSFGYPSSLYKVIDQTDSQIYALRRFDNVRITPSVISNALTKWHDIRHPGIISLYHINADKGAIFMAYAYHPDAKSIKQKYIENRGPMLNEALIWRIMIQLFSAVRLVHNKNMALRVVDVTHVLMTSGTIARFNCVGIPDIIEFESRKNLTELQMDDIVKLGRLALSLVTRAVINPSNTEEAMAVCKTHYSLDLQKCVAALLSSRYSMSNICQMFHDRIQDEFDTSMAAGDVLHSHLRNEYENGRLLRLLFKLGFVNERPEYELDPQWSETGDRYILKLFRDYLFHQQAGAPSEHIEGSTASDPVLDMGHVLTALNKVDVGDPEELILSSRDSKDLFVVTYADIQRCLEGSFVDLANQAHITLTNMKTLAAANAQQQQQQQQANSMSGMQGSLYGGQGGYSNSNLAGMAGGGLRGGGVSSNSLSGMGGGGAGNASPVPGYASGYGGGSGGGFGGPSGGAAGGSARYGGGSTLFVPSQQQQPSPVYGGGVGTGGASPVYGGGYGGGGGGGGYPPTTRQGGSIPNSGANPYAGGLYGQSAQQQQYNPYGGSGKGRGGGIVYR